ncbi:putative COMPASS complex subunit Sdc1 [Talaromyces proteolyticus]|uniref:COMPASS complex subunit Sdc1 n=1 Tax=Talaromyces proteolyticus TaxID=1131652 RepID=A0AAD4Q2W8_9EURO|nr:putative COMPASS complex subunit Sdc1 [Talaromyces proteolyticus]KAH8700778.1 putative COMPASS complex subunit Sdc1 [Talaromyces proteolyticus]
MSSNGTPVGNHSEPHNSATPVAGGPDTTSLPTVAGGAPARLYMNEKIVPYLLEGMKRIAQDQPPNPLKVLGEFLIQKSNEVEQEQNN